MSGRELEAAGYRPAEEKRQFDSVTVAFAQTYLNVLVWRAGLSVTTGYSVSPCSP
jgi:hypothetical protein